MGVDKWGPSAPIGACALPSAMVHAVGLDSQGLPCGACVCKALHGVCPRDGPAWWSMWNPGGGVCLMSGAQAGQQVPG